MALHLGILQISDTPCHKNDMIRISIPHSIPQSPMFSHVFPCPAMPRTMAPQVLPETRRSFPALSHLDGTARHQSVARTEEPWIHALLMAVGKRTGLVTWWRWGPWGPGRPWAPWGAWGGGPGRPWGWIWSVRFLRIGTDWGWGSKNWKRTNICCWIFKPEIWCFAGSRIVTANLLRRHQHLEPSPVWVKHSETSAVYVHKWEDAQTVPNSLVSRSENRSWNSDLEVHILNCWEYPLDHVPQTKHIPVTDSPRFSLDDFFHTQRQHQTWLGEPCFEVANLISYSIREAL